MAERHAITPEVLRSEAQLLSHLLALHRNDLEHVRQGRKFIIFIDAHELKAHLRANKADNLDGFYLDAERALYRNKEFPQLELEVQLKAERVQQSLLYESDGPVILLPGHGQEMDEEAAFIEMSGSRDDLKLASLARSQIESIRARTLSHQMLSELTVGAQGGSKDDQIALIRFLSRSAPALAALFFVTPDSPRGRLGMLIRSSNVVSLGEVPWEHYGFPPNACTALRAYEVSRADVTYWRRQLDERRKNSNRANRLDAEALAHMSGMNRLLRGLGVDAQSVLVTRAVTLLNSVRAAERSSHTHPIPDIVRHSRLLVAGTGEGHRRGQVAEPVPATTTTLESLCLALQTYESRLRVVPQRPAEEGTWLEDAKSLVIAWQSFEGARFTIDLANAEHPEGTPAVLAQAMDSELGRLLSWLQSDQKIEALVEERLKQRVAMFKIAVFSRDAIDNANVPVRRSLDVRGRPRVHSLTAIALGPIGLAVRFLDSESSDLGRTNTTLRLSQYDDRVTDVTDDYLAWAFAHGCRGHWRLAAIYAEHAELSARIFRRDDVAHEALLLHAQLLRIGGQYDSRDRHLSHDRPAVDKNRIEHSLGLLERGRFILNDPRVAFERACLELAGIGSNEHFGELGRYSIAHGLDRLEGLLEGQLSDEDALRLRELLLVHVIVYRRLASDSFDLPEANVRVESWHRDLVAGMDRLRQQHDLDELPRQLRAVEILGYELIRTLGASGLDMQPGDDIPGALLVDVVDLQAQLSRYADPTSALLAAELATLIDRTRSIRQFQLVYAPIWDRAEVDAGFAQIAHVEASSAALDANAILHEVGSSQRFLQGNQHEQQLLLTALDRFEFAIQHVDASHRCRFHLDVECCYIRLLLALTHKPEIREQELHRVAEAYLGLVGIYPMSSIVRYRLSIALTDLGRHEQALEAIKEALALLDQDSFIDEGHWLGSIVRRRLALHFAAQAQDALEMLKVRPEDGDLRATCLRQLREAFLVVYDRFNPTEAGRAYLERLEFKRRLNNLVYYAALYIGAGGPVETLQTGFNSVRLKRLTMQLHADGIREVAEWGVAHTIGKVYAALGERQLCAEAAERVLALISRSKENADSKAIRLVLNDALSWKGDVTTVPSAFA